MASPNPTHHFFEGLGEKTDDIHSLRDLICLKRAKIIISQGSANNRFMCVAPPPPLPEVGVVRR